MAEFSFPMVFSFLVVDSSIESKWRGRYVANHLSSLVLSRDKKAAISDSGETMVVGARFIDNEAPRGD